MITTFVGDGEVGKSTVAYDIAARVTRGDVVPRFDARPDEHAPQGSVVVLSKEDDIGLIIRSRLEAADADLDKVVTLGYAVPEDATDFDILDRLNTRIKDLEGQIIEIGDVRLLIIDPITDFVGGIDFNRDDDIRRLMTPIARLAAKHDFAVIMILHLNKKSDQPAQYRGLGQSSLPQKRT